MILKYIGYKILDGLYMLFIGVENIVANARKSLGQIVDYKRIDKQYNIDTQLISDSTYIPSCIYFLYRSFFYWSVVKFTLYIKFQMFPPSIKCCYNVNTVGISFCSPCVKF